MMSKKSIKNTLLAIALVAISASAFAALSVASSGSTASKASKYSLANISLYSKKAINFSLYRNNLFYKGNKSVSENKPTVNTTDNTVELQYEMQFDKGNFSYSLPQKFKLKLPKFKLPAPVVTH